MMQRVWREYFVFIYFLFQLPKLLPSSISLFAPSTVFTPLLWGSFCPLILICFVPGWFARPVFCHGLTGASPWFKIPLFGSARARLHNPKARVMIFKHWSPLARPMTQIPILQPLGKGGCQSPTSLFSFCPVASYKKDERRKVKAVMETLFQQICSLDGFTCWKSEKKSISRNCWHKIFLVDRCDQRYCS